MTLENALLAAVAALSTAVVTLFGIIRVQINAAQKREDCIREQCSRERTRLEADLAATRREFTEILYRMAGVSPVDDIDEATGDSRS
jgi:hypothetical protein